LFLAEAVRFELTDVFQHRRFSRPVHSTTLPHLRTGRRVYLAMQALAKHGNHKHDCAVRVTVCPCGAFFEDYKMENRLYTSDTFTGNAAVAKNKVLRNTYALLALSMLPTILGAFVGVQMGFQLSGMMGFVVFMAGAFAFMFAIEKFKNSSLGVALLLAFTFFMGLMLSRLIGAILGYSNGASLIGLAAGGTGLAFLGLSAVATTTKRDLSNMGKFLAIGSILLLAAIVANLFFNIPALSLTIVVVLLGLSCAWLVYDINRVVTGGETNYVSATLAIYLNVYNIFQSLLSLLGIFGGDRD
jgi:modulator of FtsH protease